MGHWTPTGVEPNDYDDDDDDSVKEIDCGTLLYLIRQCHYQFAPLYTIEAFCAKETESSSLR